MSLRLQLPGRPVVRGSSRLLVTALALAALTGTTARAHPSHVTIAEAEVNASADTLEVALRVNPVDLEAVLRRRGEPRVDLDAGKDVDRLIVDYLNDVFVVRNASGRRCQLRWVGKQVEVKRAWLYFEILLDGASHGTLENRVFLDLLSDQHNTVILKAGKKKTTLQFSRERARRRASFQETPSRAAAPTP